MRRRCRAAPVRSGAPRARVPLADLLTLAKRHHKARAIAEDAVVLFDEHVRRPLRERIDAEKAGA
jgi:hypothetical protein